MPTTPYLHILAEAAPLLASLDLDEALHRLERLVVPEIADWCVIHLLGEGGAIERVEVAHRDPDKVAFAREFQRRYPPDPENSLVYAAMASGQGSVIDQVTEDMLRASRRDEAYLEQIRALAIQSVITVPLRARGRTHGALTLITEQGGRVYDAQWLTLTESMAALAALAVDNARLYGEVSRTRERLEAILHGIPEGVTVQGEDGRLLFANDGAARALGLKDAGALLATPAADIISRFDVLDEHGRPFPLERLPGRRALQGEAHPSAVLCYRSRDTGVVRWVRILASRLPDTPSGPVMAVNAMQDITSYIEYEQKLESAAERQASLARDLEEIVQQVRAEQEVSERARAEAEHANAAKTQFLAVVSHELRTPLNAISGFTELLAMQVGGELNPVQLQHLSRIDSSTRHLTSLIEQILTFSRIEAGREDVDMETVDVARILLEVADSVEPLASRKALRFERGAVRPPVFAEADAPRLRQVLLNLVANAIKFTDQGGVRLEVERNGGSVLVRVSDTGSGIPPAELERIFEPFTQVDASATRRVGGTGLGLAVSRHLARLMGGEIEVESEQGRGSRFTLRLDAPADAS